MICACAPRAAWVPVGAYGFEEGGMRETGVNETRISSIPPQVPRRKMTSSNPPMLVDFREEEELAGGMLAWNAMR